MGTEYKQFRNTRYQVSTNGLIRRDDGFIPPMKCAGSAKVFLEIDGRLKFKAMHNIIAETFIPNPMKYKFVIHKDGNRFNNKVENLKWSRLSMTESKILKKPSYKKRK